MDLKNKTLAELKTIIAGYGGKEYVSKYIFSFLHQHNVNDINLMTTLSKDMRQKLIDDGFFISQLKILDKLCDPDGTVKYLFETADSNKIESVLLDESDFTGRAHGAAFIKNQCRSSLEKEWP